MTLGWSDADDGFDMVHLGCFVAVLVPEGDVDLAALCPKDYPEFCRRSQGDVVEIVGTPFGAHLGLKMSSSLSQGIISSIFVGQVDGKAGQAVLLLIDANVLPGCEGCPVYDNAGKLTAVLGPPLRASAVGATFHLAWPIDFIISEMGEEVSRYGTLTLCQPVRTSKIAVVGVHCNDSWASGILLANNVVLTNSHAINSSNGGIRVRMADHGSMPLCRLLYSFQSIDLAVLQVMGNQPGIEKEKIFETSSLESVLASTTPHSGTEVLICGFPIWKPNALAMPINRMRKPVLTYGNITKQIKDDSQQIAAFTTNAAVVNGASGSAVVDATTGLVCGLVTSNTKLVRQSRSTIFPHLNYCIPIEILRGAINAVASKTERVFEQSLLKNGTVYVWATMGTTGDIVSKL